MNREERAKYVWTSLFKILFGVYCVVIAILLVKGVTS